MIGVNNKFLDIKLDGPVYEREDFKSEEDFKKYLIKYDALCDQELERMRKWLVEMWKANLLYYNFKIFNLRGFG